MRHLLEYESYENVEKVNESSIPVYNEETFIKNVHAKPEMEIAPKQVCAVIEGLLDKVEAGEIERISVIADVPTQGKNAPQYVRDLMAKERMRLGKRYTAAPDTAPEGSRIEKRRTETGETYDEFTGEINVFVDSEFVIQSVVREAGRDYVIGIPVSYVRKVESNPSLKEYYTVNLLPQNIEEVHFIPAK
jgi:hypothetical protein